MNDELEWMRNEAGNCSTAKSKTVWSYIPLPMYTILVSYLSKGMGAARILSTGGSQKICLPTYIEFT
jgi:hypothetical protein